ncbi:MAG: peptidylprolyl isomerase [Proteobacteria bacterium]|nr:peptidylprolyl isomerase [Pseudomonadota bacterium]
MRTRTLLAPLALLFAAATAAPQSPPLTRADSALVGRVLLAEARRDAASPAFADAARSADDRVRLLARRARARIGDPRFSARDSFPALPAPPAYADPAWRLRYRALTAKSTCAELQDALADTVWHVRLRAADLLAAPCAHDAVALTTLRAWIAAAPAAKDPAHVTGRVSWHAAAHALVAMARLAPNEARAMLPRFTAHANPWLRGYAARAAAVLADTATLRTLARDANDNVKELAIDGLAKVAAHAHDDVYLAALGARGYQAVRAAARALKGAPDGAAVAHAAIAAAARLRRDSSETSRDARTAVLERIAEFARPADAPRVAALATDFDCVVADSAAAIATRLGATAAAHCTPFPVPLPADAVSLALGAEHVLEVRLAPRSGGGVFTVRLRGDAAPIMAARILALVRAHWYDGRTWYRVEPDFVIQGGGPGSNEYVGHPRFLVDELGTIPHVRGTVGMSTRGHDTGDSQWFVNLKDNLRLGRDYTVFGEVTSWIEVVDAIVEGDAIASIREVTARASGR